MCFCGGHNRTRVEAYLASLKSRRYSVKTLQTYGFALHTFLSFFQPEAGPPKPCAKEEAAKDLQDITAEDIETYRLHLMRRGLAPASLEVFLRSVRLFFRWLEETGRVFLNPCGDFVPVQPVRRLHPVPSEDDLRRLLERPDVSTVKGLRDRALLETAYACGARREELARLRLRDVDLNAGTIRIRGKGSVERMTPLGRHAAYWLGRYLDEARPRLLSGTPEPEALWLGVSGRPFSGELMNRQVKKYARAAGTSIPVTLHGLRRACATHMLQHGAHPVQLQMLLGHATLRHLSPYLRLTITDLKRMHASSRPGT